MRRWKQTTMPYLRALQKKNNIQSALFTEVVGSIPDGVIEIFHSHNPSGRTMALELTQPLTEMSTRSISWEVKAAGV
jgi:hypothetical protein